MLHPVMHPPDLRGERTRIGFMMNWAVSLMVCQRVVCAYSWETYAGIGSRKQEDDLWGMARGPGLGSVNDSSKELLNFLNTHQITA